MNVSQQLTECDVLNIIKSKYKRVPTEVQKIWSHSYVNIQLLAAFSGESWYWDFWNDATLVPPPDSVAIPLCLGSLDIQIQVRQASSAGAYDVHTDMGMLQSIDPNGDYTYQQIQEFHRFQNTTFPIPALNEKVFLTPNNQGMNILGGYVHIGASTQAAGVVNSLDYYFTFQGFRVFF